MVSYLIKVISSWQIIAVTVALILYITLVSYVAQVRRRVDFSFGSGSKAKKEKKEKAPAEAVPEGSDDEDLGLEEE